MNDNKKLIGSTSKSGVKHIAQLSPAKRAIADQSIREVMLAIVVAQEKPVKIPIEALNKTANSHRLIIEIDAENVTLSAEKIEVIKP